MPEYCLDDSECNPGQICVARVCKDSFLKCAGSDCDNRPDACQCQILEQRCSTSDGKSSCHYNKCGADGVCPEGTRCFNTFCVGSIPCSGRCPVGKVCLTDRDECIPAPTECYVECGLGQLKVFKDPATGTYEACQKIECSCEDVPEEDAGFDSGADGGEGDDVHGTDSEIDAGTDVGTDDAGDDVGPADVNAEDAGADTL